MNKAHLAALHGLLALLLLGASSRGLAHHSMAMFDMEKVVTLSGTVTEFQWTNPHCFIQLSVPKGSAVEEWSVEMAAPLQLFARGWKKSMVRPGDRISVVIHPMRDGSKGGVIVSAASVDGKPIGTKS